MTGWLPRERRLSFGPVAERYERARPSYPDALVEDVLAYGELGAEDRILEVGAGTGKATRQFAARGHPIVALEPSHEMASVARRACAGAIAVTIVEQEFERWPVEPATFALVISAQAWHWIDPDRRYGIARLALRSGGGLAVFWNRPDWAACRLRGPLSQAYERAAPEFDPSGPMHPRALFEDLLPDWQAEIEAADGFAEPEVRDYRWTAHYRAESYVDLLGTHSDHIALGPAVGEALGDAVAATIDAHGGTLELPHVTRLCLARAA